VGGRRTRTSATGVPGKLYDLPRRRGGCAAGTERRSNFRDAVERLTALLRPYRLLYLSYRHEQTEAAVTHILALNCSIAGETSVSRALVAETILRLREKHPEASLTLRDLGEAPVAHLTPDTVAGVRGVPATDAELATQALSDSLIAELEQADIVVIGAPMYNFSIPTSLRAWFDHVLRPRVTFSYSESGPQGLMKGKRAIVVETRGGLYSEGPSKAVDFQEPYLRQLLAFIGITDVTFIHAEKLGFGPEARELAVQSATTRIVEAVV
jgi:FMN-dependent NADH-azoreductase